MDSSVRKPIAVGSTGGIHLFNYALDVCRAYLNIIDTRYHYYIRDILWILEIGNVIPGVIQGVPMLDSDLVVFLQQAGN